MIRVAGRAMRRVGSFMGAADGGLGTKVVRSGVWVGISNGGQSVLQTLRSIILARLLGPEAFGLMGICMIVIRGLELFTQTGVSPALIYRQDRIDEAKHTAFTLQLIRGFVLAAAALAIAPLAARYYEQSQLRDLIFTLAAVFAMNGFYNINTVLLQKNLDFRRLTSLELSVAVVSTAATVALAYWLRSVWALVLGQVLLAVMRVALSYAIVPGRIVLRFDRGIARELLSYGRYITGITVVLFITTEVDNMVIGKVLGFEWLGYYAMAFTLANLPATHIAKIASNVLFPAYSTLQKDPERIRIAYVTVLRAVGGIAIPAAVGLATLAPEIVGIVYGPKWLPAVTSLRILALFGAARAIGMLGGYLYNALGKPRISFYLSAVKLAVILVLIYPATIRYGVVGAALAVSIPQIIGDAIGLVVVQREIALRPAEITRVLGRIAFASLVMAAVLVAARWLLSPIGPWDLAGLIALGGLSYGLVSLGEIRRLYSDHLHRAVRQVRSPATPTAV
jgi:O-antigen/teichoic acid export membrane protein